MRFRAAVVCALALALAGCTGSGTHSPSASPTGPAGAGDTVTITPGATPTGAQLRYGNSIGRLPGVTYQSDVVVLGGGASAIRSADANGYMWTIDGSAPGASRLHVGSIMLATTLASGRVLAIKDAGGDRQVVLGPVALTDVIRDGSFGTGSPVPITGPVYYSFPSDPTAVAIPDTDSAADAHSAGEHRLAGKKPRIPSPTALPTNIPTAPPDTGRASGSAGLKLPLPTTKPTPINEGDFTFTPFCCSPTAGIHIAYHGPNGRMVGDLGLSLATPKLDARVKIGGSSLIDASIRLTGAAAVNFDFEAATKNVQGNVPRELFSIPVSITIPATPFSITLTQRLTLSIQLAGQAVLKAHGKYAMTGALGVSFHNGKPAAETPSFTTVQSAMDSAASAGVSVNAVLLAYHARLTVGFGTAGITIGPFVGITASLAIAKDGSPPQTSLTAGCVTAKVVVTGEFGVGYAISSAVAHFINKFLEIFGAKPIKPVAGPTWGPYSLWNPGQSQRCLKR